VRAGAAGIGGEVVGGVDIDGDGIAKTESWGSSLLAELLAHEFCKEGALPSSTPISRSSPKSQRHKNLGELPWGNSLGGVPPLDWLSDLFCQADFEPIFNPADCHQIGP
jgi:hypothetical protein